METKICKKCSGEKPVGDFYSSSVNKDGLRSYCKTCVNKANNDRESKYRDKRKEYRDTEKYKKIKQNYYKVNKEKILSENAAWRQTYKGRLMSYKRAAKARKIEWLLTDEEFKSFWGKECYYCGESIETIGIDRMDNNKPYVIDNCCSCCTSCNVMKMTLNKDEFLKKIKQILTNLNKKL